MTEVCSSPATHQKQQQESSSPASSGSAAATGAVSASPARQSSCREEHLQEISSFAPKSPEKSVSLPGSTSVDQSGGLGHSGNAGKSRNFRRNSGGVKRNAPGGGGGRDSVDFAGKFGPKRPRFIPPSKFLLGGNIRDPLNLNSIPEVGPSGTTPSQSPRNTSNPSSPRLGPVEIRIPKWSRDPLGLAAITGAADPPPAPIFGGKRKRKRRETTNPRFGGRDLDLKAILEDTKRSKTDDSGSFSDSEIQIGQPKKIMGTSGVSADAAVNLISPEAIVPAPKRPRGMSFHGTRKPPPYDPIVSPVREKPPSMIGTQKSSGSQPQGSPKKKSSVEETGEEKGKGEEEKKLSNRARARKEREEKFNPNAARFKYGNYDRYYGKRLPDRQEDTRLRFLEKEWFENKDVLDIGCNIGHVTTILARDFSPKNIVGIDIDGHLIGVARKNVRRQMDAKRSDAGKFPPSFAKEYGPLSAPAEVEKATKSDGDGTAQTVESDSTKSAEDGTKSAQSAEDDAKPKPSGKTSSNTFPANLTFKQGNYVLNSDALLDTVKEEYDTIVALSITKWIHLNWGDEGMKRFLKRCYRNLRPGGRLVLEPQPFSSYKKRKRISAEILGNYQAIQFKPEHFTKYLLSKEVGFKTITVAGLPSNKSKGFQRPIQVFKKPGMDTQTGSSGASTATETKEEVTSKEEKKDISAKDTGIQAKHDEDSQSAGKRSSEEEKKEKNEEN